jgi:hypothetical protein
VLTGLASLPGTCSEQDASDDDGDCQDGRDDAGNFIHYSKFDDSGHMGTC